MLRASLHISSFGRLGSPSASTARNLDNLCANGRGNLSGSTGMSLWSLDVTRLEEVGLTSTTLHSTIHLELGCQLVAHARSWARPGQHANTHHASRPHGCGVSTAALHDTGRSMLVPATGRHLTGWLLSLAVSEWVSCRYLPSERELWVPTKLRRREESPRSWPCFEVLV